ncbi:MAG: tRNA 2-thiouridine(34) synthase MnmA [Pseudomonadota bacterium]
MDTTETKIGIAMSGGVDSTVCAALLRERHTVHGFFMDIGLPDREKQISRVSAVAAKLDIPLEIIDLSQSFDQEVIHYFRQSYFAGKTPNPCVICNPRIKFGKLLECVRRRGMDIMATGHYVRLRQDENGYHLIKGRDTKKDQSYFLCGLGRDQLSRLVFPLGDLTKEEVYQKARDLGFSQFQGTGTESQDVCFLQQRSVADFLKEETDWNKGDIVTGNGKKVGVHNGFFQYTIGQRRGLGICDHTPYYVTGLDAEKNRVIVGKEEDLWHQEFLVTGMNWISGSPPPLPARFMVRIRYRHREADAEVSRDGDYYRIFFHDPQRAITPGQFAVLYQGQEMIGGGEVAG